MKKITLLLLLCIGVLKGYSQCTDCHQGMRYPDTESKRLTGALPPDSSGGLAKSYILQNVCGLNWTQSSVLVETRSKAYSFNTNGTGLPSTVPLTFSACNVDSVVKAFLYFNGSYQTAYAANPASVTITNPAAQVYNYLVDSIGTAGLKCWGERGTIAYRGDVTSCINGGGNYTIDLTGTGLTSWAIDGISLVVIYIDKSASYSGSIVLYDGLYTCEGGSHTQTFTGFNVCNATPTGQAFSILADMQSNACTGNNTETYNGSTQTFPNLFYNFCTVTTPLAAAQTSTTYSVYTNNRGCDCYSWVLAGLYWQNTNCLTCTPSINPTLTLSIVPPRDTICGNDSVQLTASGASTYVWSPATGLSCTNCPNPKALPNSTTTYTLTGFNGCAFGKDTVQIVVVPATSPTVTPSNPQICSPDSVQLTVTGGAGYLWKPSATLSCSNCSNPYASPTVTTTYTVYSGSNACKDSAMVTVTVEPTPTITIIPQSPTICAGGSVTLNASGASSYSWTPVATLSCNLCNDPIATPTATTVYTVVGSNGICSKTVTDTVHVIPAPVPSITLKPDSVCQGDSALLIAGGGGTYKWNTNQTKDSIWVTPPATRTYTLHVSNGACNDSITVTVPVIPAVTASARTNIDSVCPGGSAILTVTSAGGNATYSWSPGGGTTSNLTVTPDSTTTYTVTVTGRCNTLHENVKVTVVPVPQPVIHGSTWKCRGVRDTLTATNLNGPATYIWSNGKTTSSYAYTAPIDGDSIITVTAYNKLGCHHDTSILITLRLPDTIKFNPVTPFCANTPVCITPNITGNPGPISYSWSPGGGTTSTLCVTLSDTTSYVLTVSNGCKSTKAITLMTDYPNLNACCSQTISIVDDTVTPSTLILTANGNSVHYAWAPSVTCLDPICDSVKVSPSPSVTTTYTVTGTDANNCTTFSLVTISVDVPCFNLTIPNVFTPNNGGALGLDKVFYISARNMDAWSLTIYDRWGKELFTTTDQYKYWDGTTKSGGEAPAGVYYYMISGTCQNTTYKKDGYLQLIR